MNKYSQIGRLLSQAVNSRRSLKSIVLASSDNPSFIRQAYSLLSKALAHYPQLSALVADILANSDYHVQDPNLLITLMLDLFNTENQKRKKVGGKLSRLLKDNAQMIRERLHSLHIFESIERFIHIRSPITLPFPSQPDEHIPDLHKVNYSAYSAYLKANPDFMKSNTYIVQSKSSALPAYLLLRNLRGKRADIIDCCAAPGNKTIQLAQYARMHNIQGTVYACEKDPQRFQLLQSRLQKYECGEVKALNLDFLTTKPADFAGVKIALLDPSCSGSGMRQQRLVEGLKELDIAVPPGKLLTVRNLADMQLQMLNHLSRFPKLRLVIYSTCSLYKEENEEVADAFLRANGDWTSVNLFPEWEDRGLTNCHYVRVSPHESDGFFIAMFKKP